MASSTCEKPPSSSIVANDPSLVTMEAKMIVATSHGHCQQLKDMLLSKKDGSTMVVVVASSNKTSMLPKPPSPAINYRLLAAACSGSFEDLESLLDGEDRRQASSNRTIGSSAMPRASDDEEAFLRQSLLDGVTSNGDTLLHMVATNGDSEDFLNKAGLIHRKAEKLLFTGNNKGDTPLHCAARAANSQMVSFLIALAKGQDNNTTRVKAMLEKENGTKETALHEAVRVGNNDIVKLLMEEHPQLASLPKGCTSPLYLAISLENKTIAETLHEKSGGALSYSGPNGQNALHAAVLRSKDLTKMLLRWNKDDLTIQRDEKENTPLHFASSVLLQKDGHAILLHLLETNPDALYQQDNDGSYPIHVLASVGATRDDITLFLKTSPACAGLLDARERTFLHVAVDKETG
ncbi:ankyrin-2-like [Brachypodium distachyon]|uniref:Uncharacterized protein n=1 Tax=Brachypodium distachyon TaxID=15368 RepID=A0A2K2D609_BRADI|nr:ankyrin-2-like [Brachypodium distachyon]XP_024317995.1 ankyrin-2-like [Brachypodium distachyon]PNT69705.1 hypothetical protein BRADI_3g60306v3 [Brachypodium distachyon]PNT69706.1 hypothetical protein BRADI_3g60306v3 [Brachypodium distachyon]PNT69707.1 hypothetical protein BRADI_3g60306v3 [Brachypodium distachyon]|eukprot:XP_024317994.1 ankyrin-2-like [Brachypodium distachyon]